MSELQPEGEISSRDQKHFLYQPVNMFISAVKLGILTCGSMETESVLEPASSGHWINCSFCALLCIGFMSETWWFPLD